MKILVHEGFPFVKELNKFMQLVDAGSLIKKWQSNNLIKVPYLHVDKTVKRMILKHFYGCLFIWVLIKVTMTTTFFFFWRKLFTPKLEHPMLNNFWIDMIIDPDRYFLLKTK